MGALLAGRDAELAQLGDRSSEATSLAEAAGQQAKARQAEVDSMRDRKSTV